MAASKGSTGEAEENRGVVTDLQPAFVRATAAGQELSDKRSESRARSIMVIREIERRLQDAIGTDFIRGMVDLTGGQVRVVGARVNSPAGIDAELPWDGRRSLVLSKQGKLGVVFCATNGDWDIVPAADEDLRAEDVEPFAKCVREVLERHTRRLNKTAAGYERSALLAEKLAGVLGFSF